MKSMKPRLLVAVCLMASVLSSPEILESDLAATTTVEYNDTTPFENVTTTTTNMTTVSDDDSVVMCSLCEQGDAVPQDPTARFVASGDLAITCENAYRLGRLSMARENCTFLQDWGRTLCRCSTPSSSNSTTTTQRCTLCEDGSSIPYPSLAGLRSDGEPCAALDINARRDPPSLCSAWQTTVGLYCGCDNRKASRYACRICGEGVVLPDPLKAVDSAKNGDSGNTCGEMEFQANLPDSNCQAFQHLYSSKCCDDRSSQPIQQEATSPAVAHLPALVVYGSFSLLFLPLGVLGVQLF